MEEICTFPTVAFLHLWDGIRTEAERMLQEQVKRRNELEAENQLLKEEMEQLMMEQGESSVHEMYKMLYYNGY